MYNLYEIVESTIPEIEVGEVLPARQITAKAKRLGYITEVNSEIGLVELYDKNQNKIVVAYRVYV